MGFSLSWVAVRGKSREEIHQELSITSTGIYHEFPEPPCCGALLPGGWYLVVKDHLGVFDDHEQLAKLSNNAEAITCFVEEHVMVSEVTGWRDGKKIWSIQHDSQKKIDHLDAQGTLPSEYDSIRERLQARQVSEGEADYIFDVPVEVAQSITGYRHDRFPNLGEVGFEALNIAKQPWFKRWFRKF
jgi:hypothetical protein